MPAPQQIVVVGKPLFRIPGQSKVAGGQMRLRAGHFCMTCMTLHDALASVNRHFLSFPGF
jgi:hypothetical protein